MSNVELDRKLERLRKAAQEKWDNEVVQLPLWPEIKRGTPNSFLRSALFSAIQSKDRQFVKDVVMYSHKDVQVKYRGEQLNQEDLTLWETLVHMARNNPLGNEAQFSANGILKKLEMSTGGKDHERLHAGLLRLTACAVQIKHEGRIYFGSLIESGATNEISRDYKIKLNRDLIKLYGDTQWTGIDWEQRKALRRKPLAQFLHAYYSTHAKPFPLKLETLQGLSGSSNAQKASFKRQVKAALESLIEIGFLSSFEFKKDLVEVERTKRVKELS